MAEELQGRGMGLGAEVILEFDKSIKNIQAFGEQLELLDARFGNIESRIDAMKSSLSALSSQVSKATGNNLRKTLEQELNNLVLANGIVLSSVGTAPLKVKQETVRHLLARVDAELNRAILRQIENIQIKINPNLGTGVIPIGKDEFEELNKEIARLVKTQVKHLVDAVRQNGGGIINKDSFAGLELDISKGTVKQILLSIKEQLKPIILNPKVDVEGQVLTINQKDLVQMMNKVKAQIKEALAFDFEGVLNRGNQVDEEIYKTARKIDSLVEDYVKSMRAGMERIDPRTVEVPIKNLSRRLQKFIADDLKVSPQELERTLGSIDIGSAHGYELRRQFAGLERTINSKISAGTSKLMTQLKQSVRAVEIEPSGNLKHYLIHEINKLNNEIVKKIRESIDRQFQHMRAEIESVNTSPRSINRSGRIRSMASMAGGNTYNNTTIINNNAGGNRRDDYRRYSDPYMRRDAYFNGFGLEGAIVNTVRHILAGSIVGTPIMMMYQAIEQFKTAQMEQLKMMQNMALKEEYTKSDGTADWGKIDSDIDKVRIKLYAMSNLYAIEYGQLSQVAAIASRLTNDSREQQMFVDQAAQIYRLDNESDLVETIAPGLESIMAQFKLSVWHLDSVVKAFGVATQVTKATSDEIMKAMSRSGSALHAAGVTAEEAVALNALAIQTSGQSGENIGNALKTIAARVTLPSVVDKLERYGIRVFEENDMGLKVRRSLIEILADTARVANSRYLGEDALMDILLGEGGGYQYPKLLSFLEGMHKAGIEDAKSLSFWRIKKEIDSWIADPNNTELMDMLARTINSPAITFERTGVSVQNALVSVLEELSPEIQELAQVIINLSEGMENNASLFADLVGVLSNALIGFSALYGIRKMGEWGQYDTHYNNAMMEKRFFGGTTLTGRQVYGAVDFLENHVIGGNASRTIRNRLNDMNFYRAAMQNDLLRGYFEELSNLNNDRRREIRQYVKDHAGLVDNLADLFIIMDESRGYRRQREELSEDEVHRRSAFNARQLTSSKTVATVFAQEFAQELVGSLSERQRFDNLNEHDRTVARRLASMDDGRRRDFEAFLTENYSSVGRVIEDMEGLNRAIHEYEDRNRQAAVQARRSSEAYRDLGRAINQVADEASGATKGRLQSFMDFLDTIPQRARGAGGAIMGLARNIGSFAKQLAVAVAVGDIISDNAETLGLNPLQERIRDKRTATVATAEEYVKFMEDESIWSALMRAGKGIFNDIVDIFTAGNTNVGFFTDQMKFGMEFTKWLQREYGTSDWENAVAKENKRRAEEAKKQGREGIYEKATLSDLTNKYLDSTGELAKIREMEKENFIEQYKKFAIDQAEQDMRKAEAERARKAWEERMLAEGEYDYFSFEDLKSRIEEGQKKASNEGSLKLVNALLNGIKSDSEEYMKLRLQIIQQEREIYRREINDLRSFIKEREKELDYLEKKGKRWVTDPETGEKVESTEYRKIKESIERNKDKEQRLREEFELKDREKQLEAQRIETEFYITNAQKGFSRAQARKQYRDTLNALVMNTDSARYIDSQITSSQQMISEMKTQLAELQAKSLADPDGELQDAILSLQQQIASAELEVKNLRLQRLSSWRNSFGNNMDDIEIKYLQERVNLGPGLSDDSFLARDLRIRELQERKSLIDKQLAERRAELSNYSKGSSAYEQIMKDIRELMKQSLQAQLGIHQELKAQVGGTFNLPDGVRVMSQYDYMARKGTHSSVTVQSGDMYVNVILPNVTDKTGSQQLYNIGYRLGQGLAQSRAAQLRNQLNSGPLGYRSF